MRRLEGRAEQLFGRALRPVIRRFGRTSLSLGTGQGQAQGKDKEKTQNGQQGRAKMNCTSHGRQYARFERKERTLTFLVRVLLWSCMNQSRPAPS